MILVILIFKVGLFIIYGFEFNSQLLLLARNWQKWNTPQITSPRGCRSIALFNKLVVCFNRTQDVMLMQNNLEDYAE